MTGSKGTRPPVDLDAELASFRAQGYLGPIRLYSREEMERSWKKLRLDLLDRSHAVYGDETASGNTDISNYDRHLDSNWLAEHVCHSGIVERVRRILGPNVLCWRSEFFPKYPGDEGTDWHQADTFANVSGTPQIVWPDAQRDFGGTVTVWTALTPSTIETGCLQFIPGTHRDMHYDEAKDIHYDPAKIGTQVKNGAQRGFFGYDYRELQIDPDWRPAEDQAISMQLEPGECVIFWSTLLHASHPHLGRTDTPRIGFTSRYVPTCVRVYPDTEEVHEYGGRISLERFGSVLVSGKDEHHHNPIATHTTRGHRFVTR